MPEFKRKTLFGDWDTAPYIGETSFAPNHARFQVTRDTKIYAISVSMSVISRDVPSAGEYNWLDAEVEVSDAPTYDQVDNIYAKVKVSAHQGQYSSAAGEGLSIGLGHANVLIGDFGTFIDIVREPGAIYVNLKAHNSPQSSDSFAIRVYYAVTIWYME